MPAVDFPAVRAMISMAEVLRLLDYPLPHVEVDQWRGPCPVHQSTSKTSRSFSIHLRRKLFRCFRCGAEGNHIDLYAAVTRQGVYQAALDLCLKLQRPIPWRTTSSRRALRQE